MERDEAVRALVLVPVPCVVLAPAAAVAGAVPDEDGVLQRCEDRWGEAQDEVGVAASSAIRVRITRRMTVEIAINIHADLNRTELRNMLSTRVAK